MKRKVFTWGMYYLILIDEILLYNLIIMGSMAFDTLLARMPWYATASMISSEDIRYLFFVHFPCIF
jgi:hypothetical protein